MFTINGDTTKAFSINGQKLKFCKGVIGERATGCIKIFSQWSIYYIRKFPKKNMTIVTYHALCKYLRIKEGRKR